MTAPTRRRLGLGAVALAALGGTRAQAVAAPVRGDFPVSLSDAEWKRRLSRAQYVVLRQAGTEVPGTSPLDREKRAGTFTCAGCDQPLFSSKTKFESGTGWPSFWSPLAGAVGESSDTSLGTTRTGSVRRSVCGRGDATAAP